MKEWAVYGPINASTASELYLEFWMDYYVDNAASDQFASVLYSTDGHYFYYLKKWIPPVATSCHYAGLQRFVLPDDATNETLHIAFIFKGDCRGSMTVDNIHLYDTNATYTFDADTYVATHINLTKHDDAVMNFVYSADVEDGHDWLSLAFHNASGWFHPPMLNSTSG